MTETLTKHEKNLSAIIHASTFSRFVFPFGNFILPLVLWVANKKEYAFVDHNGKQALNFQISLLLYSLVLGILSVPFFLGFLPNIFDGGLVNLRHWDDLNTINFNWDSDDFHFSRFWPLGIAGLAQVALYVINIVYTILATIRTSEGQTFYYPISIKFIK